MIKSCRVPGLGNQLDIRKNRVKGKIFEQRRIVHRRSVFTSSQNGGEIKTKSVYSVFGSPIAQTFHNHLLHHRVVCIQCIAAPAEVIILSVGREQIIYIVVQSFKGNKRSLFIAFGRVVKDYVQKNLNAVIVQCTNKTFELRALSVMLSLGTVCRVGGKKRNRIIAPIIIELPAVVYAVVSQFIKFKNRHKFHAGHAQIQQIGYFFFESLKGSGVGYIGRCMLCKTPYVQFIND